MVSSAPVETLPALVEGARRQRAPSVRTSGLSALMVFAIVGVALLAFWDSRRESRSALSDFAKEQATLAQGILTAVSGRVRVSGVDPSIPVADLLVDVRSMERPSSLHVLLSAPGQDGLSTTGGSVVHDGTVEQALRDGATWVRLDRDEAPAFGLPKRTAVAGLATFAGPRGRWGLVVATTALRERDREVRAQWRSVAGVVLASGLVLLFGGLAMRKQRQELELARELEISELEREREEQLVQIDKLATMAALATGIAHEVSTPLGVIVGRAEQLLPKVTHDERAAKGVASIIEQGTRISEVIRGFLNLVRGDSPPLGRADPEAVARAAQELVLHRFEKAGVALHVVADGNLPAVACDPRLLEQVLINLLLNACDACERGGLVELAVRADDDRVRFVVVDDGVGIEPAAAAIATEPFFTTKPVGQGTGLGLAIANEIVKHYGGHFTIEPRQASGVNQPSERGPARGTRASVELPVAKEPA